MIELVLNFRGGDIDFVFELSNVVSVQIHTVTSKLIALQGHQLAFDTVLLFPLHH